MFATFKTLMIGASARAEERVRDAYALELIEQKIRDVETAQKAAKATLASLILRQRTETRTIEALAKRSDTMMARAREAMASGRSDLAGEAAEAVAQMENELTLRRETLDRLETKVQRLRTSVEAGHRRIVDLRQGAISAKAIRREQDVQMQLVRSGATTSSVEEAEALIARVLNRDDPFEASRILQEIDKGLNHDTLEERLSDQGFGPALKVTRAEILARISTETPPV
jgi:phage shock protein A